MNRFIIFFLFIFSTIYSFAQKEEIIIFQNELNKEYTDSLHSPLSKKERVAFKNHEFFPIDLSYRVTAKFTRTANQLPFKMATTKGTTKDYVKYGEVEFSIKGKTLKLNVYQSLDLLKLDAYKNYLFLPFKDLTNSVLTYGGGRFMDLRIPEGKTLVIDFNKAYNPYCAYSDLFSCPITPIENSLQIEIKAGIKGPVNH